MEIGDLRLRGGRGEGVPPDPSTPVPSSASRAKSEAFQFPAPSYRPGQRQRGSSVRRPCRRRRVESGDTDDGRSAPRISGGIDALDAGEAVEVGVGGCDARGTRLYAFCGSGGPVKRCVKEIRRPSSSHR